MSVVRHYVHGTLIVMATMLAIFYWIGFPLNNMVFVHGYPRLGAGVTQPNEFKSARYSLLWWAVYLLNLNLLLPFMLAIALMNNSFPEYSNVHHFFSRLGVWLNLVLLVILAVVWLFFTNGGSTGYNSASNDRRWCCAEFAASTEAASWCPNGSPCIPDVTPSQLSRSDEFWQAFLFSIIFFLVSLIHTAVNDHLSRYDVFKEQE